MVRHPPGFFRSGSLLELDDGTVGEEQPEWAEYRNLGSGTLGAVISSRLATLHQLDTVYGVTDLYRLAEIVKVDAFNEYVAHKWASREDRS